jgi:UDP-glucose 4-epimerase
MILVTGGAGYIGSHMVKLLGERGRDTLTLDNLSRGHREMVTAGKFIEGDLSDRGLLEDIFRSYDIGTVFHFAADSLVSESEENPRRYYRNNVANGIHLLDVMLEAGVKKIVFSSSAAVYGEPVKIPLDEDHPAVPVNVYGTTKLIMENMMKDFEDAHGLRFVSLRYFNAAGADPDGFIGEDHDQETHLVPLVLDAALGRRKDITVFGNDYDTPDGTCVRDYIHVRDLADAHLLALDYVEKGGGKSAAYNLGNGRGFSVLEVIRAAERVTGRAISLRAGGRRKGDPARLVASSEKISRDWGWKPRYADLDVIIETAWKWHRRRFG